MDLIRTRHDTKEYPYATDRSDWMVEIRNARPTAQHRVFFIETLNQSVYVWWIKVDLLAPVTNA